MLSDTVLSDCTVRGAVGYAVRQLKSAVLSGIPNEKPWLRDLVSYHVLHHSLVKDRTARAYGQRHHCVRVEHVVE